WLSYLLCTEFIEDIGCGVSAKVIFYKPLILFDMRKVKFLLLSLVVLISFTSCKNQRKVSRTDTPTSGIVEIAVDESFAPIIDEQIGVFESLYEKSSIIPIYTNDVNVY